MKSKATVLSHPGAEQSSQGSTSATIAVSFEAINGYVPILIAGGAEEGPGEDDPEAPAPKRSASTTADAKERQILFDVSGRVDPGEWP